MCQTWSDHEFGRARFLETGRHPVLGRYNRFVISCANCPRTITQTEWLNRTRATADDTEAAHANAIYRP